MRMPRLRGRDRDRSLGTVADPRILEFQYQHLHAHGLIYPLNSLVVAGLYAFIVRRDVPVPGLGAWLCAMVLLTAVRWSLLLWRPRRVDGVRRWIRLSVGFSVGSGLLWGLAIWIVPRAHLQWQVLAAASAALMAMGALPSLGMVHRAHVALAVGAVVPPIWYFVSPGTTEGLLLGLLLAGYLLNMVYAGRLVSSTLLSNLHKRLADQQLAHEDALTGLPNRRQFDIALDRAWHQALRTETPLSLLMMDLDAFKDYNDRYGHLQGDACLRQVARVLRATMRRETDLVARWGGEEFVCLLPATDARGGRSRAEEIRKAIEDAGILHAGGPAGGILTISIGGATLVPRPGQTRFLLIEAADQALYEAKRQGRNRVAWMDLTPGGAHVPTLVRAGYD